MATSYLLKNSHLWKGVKRFEEKLKDKENPKYIQQSEYVRDFMLTILNNGLVDAYTKYGDTPPGPCPPAEKSTSHPLPLSGVNYDVIIVGAGMAGISAAYELKRAGLTVKIIEETNRYGGRVFTYDDFAPGLYGEAGAMRLPGDVNNPEDRAHFLTDGYIKKFKLPIKKFPNYDENGISHIYGLQAKSEDWASKHFDTVWPQWKDGIADDMKEEITNIDAYYERTTGVVTDQLKKRLNNENTVEKQLEEWGHWIDNWSQFTLESFLESNIEVIKAKIPAKDRDSKFEETLGKLLPWSNDAIRGFSVSSYTEQLDQSLVQYLRDQLGNWWSKDMHALKGGMHSLPDAFFGKLGLSRSKDIALERKVSEISYWSHPSFPVSDYVKVSCYRSENGNKADPYIFTGRAVIITVPVNVMRQINFVPLLDDEQTKLDLRKNIQAIEDIYTGPATKVILQTKTRFWEKKKYSIKGGFSKTNLPIGQIHYVAPEVESTKQGILLIYTWKNEALMFGSLTPDQVKQEVIDEIAEIHEEIKDEVEKCIVHAWYNQPSYQGAYGLMKTTQFNNIRRLWEAMGNVHFSGENLSFTTGWIQGALESGLKSAYQVYVRHVERKGS